GRNNSRRDNCLYKLKKEKEKRRRQKQTQHNLFTKITHIEVNSSHWNSRGDLVCDSSGRDLASLRCRDRLRPIRFLNVQSRGRIWLFQKMRSPPLPSNSRILTHRYTSKDPS
ncbi:hypothetical protein PanWU01x14_360990, partial [Parasponia andersonii]